MSWVNNNPLQFYIREIDYNRSVCINSENLGKIADRFDNVFGSFTDFRDEISSLHLYPFDIKQRNIDTQPYQILSTSKGEFPDIQAYKISTDSTYMTLGELYIAPYFNSFADYKGYTQIKVFLPMVGYVDIDVNEVMEKWMQFRLTVDYNTGKGMYIVGVSPNSITIANSPYPSINEDSSMRVIATYECTVGIEIPLGQSNIGEIKRNLLLGAVKIAATATSAYYGMSLPPATTTTHTVKSYDIQGRSKAKGSRMKQIKSGTETTDTISSRHTPVNRARPIAEAFDSGIDVLNRNYNGSSSDRVNDSMLMWKTSPQVQVIIYRPKIIETGENYGLLYGYPLGEVRRIGELTGYTEITNIHFEGVGFDTITQDEINELENAFTNGIII